MVTLDAPQTNSKCPRCPFGAVRPAVPGSPSLIGSLPLSSFTPLSPPFLGVFFDTLKSSRRRPAFLIISQTRGDARPVPITRQDRDSLAKRLCEAERLLWKQSVSSRDSCVLRRRSPGRPGLQARDPPGDITLVGNVVATEAALQERLLYQRHGERVECEEDHEPDKQGHGSEEDRLAQQDG